MSLLKETIVKTALLKPEQVDRYEQLHAQIPAVIETNIRATGIHSLRIYRKGLMLIMIIEVELETEGASGSIDQQQEDEWQRLTGACFAELWQDAAEIYSLNE